MLAGAAPLRDRDEVAASVSAPPAVDLPPRILLSQGLSIAGLPVGGLTVEEARAALATYRLEPLRRPLLLRLGDTTLALYPERVGLRFDAEPALSQASAYAREALQRHWGIYLGSDSLGVDEPRYQDLPVPVEVNEAALHDLLESLALVYEQAPRPLRPAVLTDTAALTAQGVHYPAWSEDLPPVGFLAAAPGCRLDTAAVLPQVEAALKQWSRAEVVVPWEELPPPPADMDVLAEVIREQVAAMPGVVGIYVRDLATGREVTLHDQVVFSGASVMKIAILLQAYRVLDEAPQGQVAQDLETMMVWSDNDAANRLLELGGEGDDARGAQHMTAMLRRLGLNSSFLCNRYGGGPHWSGCPPEEQPAGGADKLLTRADEVLQTTPRDMGRLLAYIYQCSQGQGPILQDFPGEVTPAECRAMLQLMRRNEDNTRLVAGLPAGIPAAHKSGWIDDMKADAGIVFSPGGTYVLSIFAWEEGVLTEQEGNQRIASLSWIVYCFFNPL
jgi:beta-lactamase class A